MRCNIWFAVMAGLVAGVAAVAPAHAGGTEPVIVVPGRPGVPVMMYGRDISWAVVEGDWGLARPGIVAPVVVEEGWPQPLYGPPGPYYPRTGHRPRSGRLEVIPPPNRRLPPPAEPYYREWGVQSGTAPASIPAPYDPPQVIVAPRYRRGHIPFHPGSHKP